MGRMAQAKPQILLPHYYLKTEQRLTSFVKRIIDTDDRGSSNYCDRRVWRSLYGEIETKKKQT